MPYQFTFDLRSLGGDEVCDPLPIPEGRMLTINSVGVTVETDGPFPRAYVRVGRRRATFVSTFRYQGALQFVHRLTETINSYSGIFNPEVFGGAAVNDADVTYRLSICVGPRQAPATFTAARGIVSGYLTAGGVADGNSLP